MGSETLAQCSKFAGPLDYDTLLIYFSGLKNKTVVEHFEKYERAGNEECLSPFLAQV